MSDTPQPQTLWHLAQEIFATKPDDIPLFVCLKGYHNDTERAAKRLRNVFFDCGLRDHVMVSACEENYHKAVSTVVAPADVVLLCHYWPGGGRRWVEAWSEANDNASYTLMQLEALPEHVLHPQDGTEPVAYTLATELLTPQNPTTTII